MTGKIRNSRRKVCLRAIFATTSVGSKPGLNSRRPANNRLTYDTTQVKYQYSSITRKTSAPMARRKPFLLDRDVDRFDMDAFHTPCKRR